MQDIQESLQNLNVEDTPDLTIISEEEECHSGILTWVIPVEELQGKRLLISKCFPFGSPDYCKCTLQLNYEKKILNNRPFTLFESIVIKFAETPPKRAFVEGTAAFVKKDGTNYDSLLFAIEHEQIEVKLEAFRNTDHINKYFWDDKLVLSCYIRMKLGISHWEADNKKISLQKHVDFETEKFQAYLFRDKKFSDVQFRIRGGITEAHKSILARDVESFRILVSAAHFEEKFKFFDIDKPTLDAMLDFVYSREIPKLTFRNACKLLIATNTYEVYDLKYICSSYIGANLNEKNVFVAMSVAHKAEDVKLKKFCIQFISNCDSDILAENSLHITK